MIQVGGFLGKFDDKNNVPFGLFRQEKKFPRGIPKSPNSWEQMVFLVSQSLIQALFIKAKPKEHF